MLLRWGCFTQLTGDTLHLFGRKLELLLQVDISLSIDGHEMDVCVVDLKEKKISVNTPIAKGLMGRKVGDVVEVQTPGGLLNFEILNISI